MFKPFLLLQLRPEDEASDNEYNSFLEFTELDAKYLQRIRMDQSGLPKNLNFNDYSGVIVGGGPSNISSPDNKKYPEQKIFEPQLLSLIGNLVDADFPFLGVCYGLGALVYQQGGIVNNVYEEPVGTIQISLTNAAKDDLVFKGINSSFYAYVGHKEACFKLSDNVKLLASSPSCPVQAVKVKNNLYATQFHIELDHPSLASRIDIYKHHGYFMPEESEDIKNKAAQYKVVEPMEILKNFVNLYLKST